jgi:catechol 2,3-dioxygenase-like lactoylglutathione lyase family enzyme
VGCQPKKLQTSPQLHVGSPVSVIGCYQNKGRHMPSFSRVAPSIYITDIDRALGFYRDGLGFSVDYIDDPPRRAVVTQSTAVLHLDVNPAKAGSSRTHMIVDDLDAVCDRLGRAGFGLLQQPTVQEWGLRDIWVADPDGNVFELAEPVRKTTSA